ncbi:23S rRNA (cytidine1920-2'-O)/16S rRNA (cytidine1409-2'-O)-methyltransferase [Microlunatus parietis]|uniref:23S rRNA (Cytidine1920-2'-O)/16S rRNA (Cytidine1409-2'-O)-methyltransferase n=1 Tax=Microlunatus parietis TaxID=682979 RepID=A0A7Y9I3L5_9ACTN|nr:23S rRNA (cytidine1920-2'-O)/16S rRNA (cytidine1409-2'-O)-methyltransferase [Microlunatus parietis]
MDRGLARSRGQARELITAGLVRVADRPAGKPSVDVDDATPITVEAGDHYVSRGAHKLLGALADLDLQPYGRAVDAGASTGGFTQVLLEAGCEQVYAIDVGHDQLSRRIRSDPRVVVWERTNLRDLELRHVDQRPVNLLVADVSFISLRLLIAPFDRVLRDDADMLIMIKPQFEVGRADLGKGGVVADPELRRAAVDGVLRTAAETGWAVVRVAPSRVPGGSGNQEFFAHLRRREGLSVPRTYASIS